MQGRGFHELQAFVAVAQSGSFTRASERLQLSTSALSQAVRSLETRLGLRLLNRTTRNVALTEAGAHLLARVLPALGDLTSAFDSLAPFRSGLTGIVRICTPRLAYSLHLAPKLRTFTTAHPGIVLDVTLDDGAADPVSAGFDITIRLRELVEQDLVAVPLGDELRQVVVASPDYLDRCGVPHRPADLAQHRCINWRWPAHEGLYSWEFQEAGRWFSVPVRGPMIVNDRSAAADAADAGIGLAQVAEPVVRERLASGSLRAVLRDWEGAYPGFHLCFPRLPQTPPAVRALIDVLSGRPH